jgi:hypothetical protein
MSLFKNKTTVVIHLQRDHFSYQAFKDAVHTSLESDRDHGFALSFYIKSEPLTEKEWYDLTKAKQEKHFMLDALVGKYIRLHLDPAQHVLILQYNTGTNPKMNDDGTYPPEYDHQKPKTWPSKNLCSYLFLMGKFAASGKNTASNTQMSRKLKARILAVTLDDYRGNVNLYFLEIQKLRAVYEDCARMTKGFNQVWWDGELAAHIVDVFKRADYGFYKNEVDELHRTEDLDSDAVIDKLSTKWLTDAPKEDNGPSMSSRVLATTRTTPDDQVDRLVTALATFRDGASSSKRDNGSKREKGNGLRPGTTADPVYAERLAFRKMNPQLFKLCVDKKVCFNNLRKVPGQCNKGVDCRFSHQELSVPYSANVVTDDGEQEVYLLPTIFTPNVDPLIEVEPYLRFPVSETLTMARTKQTASTTLRRPPLPLMAASGVYDESKSDDDFFTSDAAHHSARPDSVRLPAQQEETMTGNSQGHRNQVRQSSSERVNDEEKYGGGNDSDDEEEKRPRSRSPARAHRDSHTLHLLRLERDRQRSTVVSSDGSDSDVLSASNNDDANDDGWAEDPDKWQVVSYARRGNRRRLLPQDTAVLADLSAHAAATLDTALGSLAAFEEAPDDATAAEAFRVARVDHLEAAAASASLTRASAAVVAAAESDSEDSAPVALVTCFDHDRLSFQLQESARRRLAWQLREDALTYHQHVEYLVDLLIRNVESATDATFCLPLAEEYERRHLFDHRPIGSAMRESFVQAFVEARHHLPAAQLHERAHRHRARSFLEDVRRHGTTTVAASLQKNTPGPLFQRAHRRRYGEEAFARHAQRTRTGLLVDVRRESVVGPICEPDGRYIRWNLATVHRSRKLKASLQQSARDHREDHRPVHATTDDAPPARRTRWRPLTATAALRRDKRAKRSLEAHRKANLQFVRPTQKQLAIRTKGRRAITNSHGLVGRSARGCMGIHMIFFEYCMDEISAVRLRAAKPPPPLDDESDDSDDSDDSDAWYQDAAAALCDHLEIMAATVDQQECKGDAPDGTPKEQLADDQNSHFSRSRRQSSCRPRNEHSRSHYRSRSPPRDRHRARRTAGNNSQSEEKTSGRPSSSSADQQNEEKTKRSSSSLALVLASAASDAPTTVGYRAAAGHLLVIDSGANAIVFGDTGILADVTNFAPVLRPQKVHSNGHADAVLGSGDIVGTFKLDSGKRAPVALHGLVSPASRWNIVPPQLLPGFARATIDPSGLIVVHFTDGGVISTSPHKGLQVLRVLPFEGSEVLATRVSKQKPTHDPAPSLEITPPAPPALLRLHERLSHAGVTTLHRLIRDGVVRVADPATRTAMLASGSLDCRHCSLSSFPALRPAPSGEGHTPSPTDLGLWSTDVAGPFSPSASASRWASFWLSHRTGQVFIGFHKTKDAVFDWFAENHERVTVADGGAPITRLHSDNGETKSHRFSSLCAALGVERSFTAPGSSFQNGRVERLIRTIRAKAGASLSRSGLGPPFWAEAFSHAAYVHNRLPPTRGNRASPLQCARGHRSTLSMTHPFGCLALARLHKAKKSSLTTKARAACFLSYAPGTKDAYKILHLDTSTVAISRNVVFFHGDFPFNKTSAASKPLGDHEPPGMAGGADHDLPAARSLPLGANPGVVSHNPFASLADAGDDADDNADEAPQRPRRIVSRPAPAYFPGAHEAQRRADAAAATVVNATHAARRSTSDLSIDGATYEPPTSLRAAFASPLRDFWIDATKVELLAHRKNGTWVVAAVPAGRSAIPAMWIMKVKFNADGTIDKFKVRLVAKGFRQRFGLDFHESFAPTLRTTTLRFLIALACRLGLEAHQMDVSTAFLIPTLEEEIYMRLPEQESVREYLPSLTTPGTTVRLVKTLYGLVQSPAMFFKHLSAVLKKIGFDQSLHDPCLWLRRVDGTTTAAIGVWVDDCAIFAPPLEVEAIKNSLRRHFAMTDGGKLSWFLSVRAHQDLDKGIFTLDQQPTILKVARQYHLDQSRTVSTPMEARLNKPDSPPTDEDNAFMIGKNYRSLVGSLMYLLFTRPDIAFSVGQLSRHLNDARPDHWRAAIRVLRYLVGTAELKLVFKRGDRNPADDLAGYSDADWGGDKETRRSTTGVVFMLTGAAIYWKSKLQSSVAMSTCEAELNALVEAVREALWLRLLFAELCHGGNDTDVGATEIFEDNQAAMLIAKDHRFFERVKHVAMRYFFMREQIAAKNIKVTYCPTIDMLADIMTKPLGRVAFERLRPRLGLRLFSFSD